MGKENIQSCKRCNETYVVVSTYYKHGEYDLNIFYSELELRDFLIDEYISYDLCDKECEESEESCVCKDGYSMDIETLINIVCDVGEKYVNEERGTGVREVQKI